MVPGPREHVEPEVLLEVRGDDRQLRLLAPDLVNACSVEGPPADRVPPVTEHDSALGGERCLDASGKSSQAIRAQEVADLREHDESLALLVPARAHLPRVVVRGVQQLEAVVADRAELKEDLEGPAEVCQ